MHILDISENSIRAKASLISIGIKVDKAEDTLAIVISDNGVGMSSELLERVRSPFATTRETRDVGLGIPLFAASCERTGRALKIESTQGIGTKLTAEYCLSNIDRPPIGELSETMHALVMMNPHIDFVLTTGGSEEFVFDTRQIKKQLGEVPITNNDVLLFIKEYLSEGITEILGGI